MNLAPMSGQVDRILSHIRALAVDIGPRGSTTQGERKGAEYCQAAFQGAGLSPVWETFASAKSIFFPHVLASLGYLLSFALYPLAGRLTAGIAFLLTSATLASELLELGFIDNPLRRLTPKGESQNVHAVIPPAGEHRRDLILIGHIDTQRTPLFFRSTRWVEVYKGFTTVAFVLFAFQCLAYLLGALFQWSWIWPATLPSMACALTLLVFFLQADLTPFTAGANDNASAVGMVLSLAEAFAHEPLAHTRVYAVCTGCEEVQHFGAIDFFRRYRAELTSPSALVFELLGCAGPGYLTTEGIIVPFHSDPDLRARCERLSRQNPDWGAYPVKISGGNSELADCVRAKVPAITLFGLTPAGEAPYWHQVGDTADKIDARVLGRVSAMVRALIAEIDGQDYPPLILSRSWAMVLPGIHLRSSSSVQSPGKGHPCPPGSARSPSTAKQRSAEASLEQSCPCRPEDWLTAATISRKDHRPNRIASTTDSLAVMEDGHNRQPTNQQNQQTRTRQQTSTKHQFGRHHRIPAR